MRPITMLSKNRTSLLFAGAAATLSILSGPIQAVTYVWDAGPTLPGDRLWDTAANWNPDGIPGTLAADLANFSSTTANVIGTVTMNAPHTIESMNFSNASGSYVIN